MAFLNSVILIGFNFLHLNYFSVYSLTFLNFFSEMILKNTQGSSRKYFKSLIIFIYFFFESISTLFHKILRVLFLNFFKGPSKFDERLQYKVTRLSNFKSIFTIFHIHTALSRYK